MPNKIDEIYNLASPASPPKYQKDPLFTLNTNVIGIKNILELAIRHNAKILHASTSEIYGDPFVHPQTESYWGNVNTIGPRSCYDEGKRVAETYCYLYGLEYCIDYKLIRIFNTYGPNMDPKDGRVISNFINQALNNEDITIYGSGSQTRSFQYIDDLLNGMIKVMETDSDFHGPVNIGNPNEFTISELASIIYELIPETKSKIEFKDFPKDDPTRRKPDISLAKEKLKWKPKVELKEGLIKTINYFKSIKNENV
jgi:UDP-glucuronate decarboxylase